MAAQHQYTVNLEWTGNLGEGTSHYRAYSRNYTVRVGNKMDIPGSSDPAFRGDPSRHNPEDLLLASLSACHMLWYLHLCAEAGIVVTSYHGHATGLMEDLGQGGGCFKEVTLNPEVVIDKQAMYDKAVALHQKANALCFIANSVNFPVKHKVMVTVET